MTYIVLPLLFLFGFLLTAIFTRLTIPLAKKFHFIDDPIKHKHPAIIHKKPIPRAGGLPIFLSMALGILLFFPLNTITISILIAGVFVVGLGLLDDRLDISPYLRFFINILCAAFIVFQGVTLPFITNPLGGILFFQEVQLFGVLIPLSSILAILWIVWVMNMLNWSKGVDGQLPGIAAISAIVIGIASLRFPQLDNMNLLASHLAFLTAGAAAGFLLYNFYPAKIFPGYSGTILGFTIGILSLLSSVKLATALLVMGVPTVDALFTILRRVFERRSPFWHDKQHLHHLLLRIGWGQRRIAFFYWVLSAVLGAIALLLPSRGKLFAIILVMVLVAGFIFTLRFIAGREIEE